MWKPLVLVALLGAGPAAADLRTSDGAVLSALVANAASKDARVDVISSEDVRKSLDAEARRQLSGCSDTSCLTEIASAMNAAAVIHGSIGTLGSDIVLSLSLLDTTQGVALGRAAAKAATIAASPCMRPTTPTASRICSRHPSVSPARRSPSCPAQSHF